MAGQLDRLLALNLDNVTLGIIPFGVPLKLTPISDFLMLDDRAIVETPGGEIHVGDAESAGYAEDFGTLMGEALTGPEARRLIAGAAAGLRA